MKMQNTSLYTLPKEWFGDSIQKIKQGSLKKKKIFFFSYCCKYKFNKFHD